MGLAWGEQQRTPAPWWKSAPTGNTEASSDAAPVRVMLLEADNRLAFSTCELWIVKPELINRSTAATPGVVVATLTVGWPRSNCWPRSWRGHRRRQLVWKATVTWWRCGADQGIGVAGPPGRQVVECRLEVILQGGGGAAVGDRCGRAAIEGQAESAAGREVPPKVIAWTAFASLVERPAKSQTRKGQIAKHDGRAARVAVVLPKYNVPPPSTVDARYR